MEAGAVSALMGSMDATTRQRLVESVRSRGMKGFLTHELIAKHLFSNTFSSGSGPAEAWAMEASNRNAELVPELFFNTCCFVHLFMF